MIHQRRLYHPTRNHSPIFQTSCRPCPPWLVKINALVTHSQWYISNQMVINFDSHHFCILNFYNNNNFVSLLIIKGWGFLFRETTQKKRWREKGGCEAYFSWKGGGLSRGVWFGLETREVGFFCRVSQSEKCRLDDRTCVLRSPLTQVLCGAVCYRRAVCAQCVI